MQLDENSGLHIEIFSLKKDNLENYTFFYDNVTQSTVRCDWYFDCIGQLKEAFLITGGISVILCSSAYCLKLDSVGTFEVMQWSVVKCNVKNSFQTSEPFTQLKFSKLS